mgnify:CR=1 FL=1
MLQFFDFHQLKRDDAVQINGGDLVGMFLQMTDGIQCGHMILKFADAPFQRRALLMQRFHLLGTDPFMAGKLHAVDIPNLF